MKVLTGFVSGFTSLPMTLLLRGNVFQGQSDGLTKQVFTFCLKVGSLYEKGLVLTTHKLRLRS